MKTCFKCFKVKPLSEFYKNLGMLDGHLNKCKECTCQDSRENRIKNIDYYREYDRSRSNNPNRVEACELYSKSIEGIESHNKAKRKYTENNTIKRAASYIVNNAVRDEKLIKSYICSECGIDNVIIYGHHDDYAFSLIVRWLCSKCHRAWHKKYGTAKNGD